MNAVDEKTITVLHELMETCRDGEHGFHTAAEAEKSGEFRSIFLRYAEQRGDFIRELQAQVFALGGNGEKSGSVSGLLHRGWMNLKSAVVAGEPAAILNECERGEDIAEQGYARALEAELDPESKAIVTRQSQSVRAAHEHLRVLRDRIAGEKK